MGFPMYHTAYTGRELQRSGPNHVSIAPYGPFRSADGHVYLAVQNAREWSRFCSNVIERPDIENDQRFRTNELRLQNRQALRSLIESAFATLSSADIAAKLDAAQVAYARMNSVREFLQHPQLTARGRWTEVGSEVGPLRALPPPVLMEGVEPRMDHVPSLGEHTPAILEELGFGRDLIATWKKDAVI